MNGSVCPLCGTTDAARVYPGFARCAKCGLVRTEPPPAPSPSDEAGLYGGDYFTQRNAYLARRDEFTRLFAALLDQVAVFKPAGRLLDVGCGPGLLLEEARRRGYTVAGCDVSAWAVDYARQQGLDARVGLLEDLAYPTASFDVALANHTLEHVPDPLPFLREMGRLLKSDGLLVIGVPNFGSLMSSLMRARWHALLPDQHYWHFTPATLDRMLRAAGFAPRRILTQTGSHKHASRARALALNAIVAVARPLNRSEGLLALCGKAD